MGRFDVRLVLAEPARRAGLLPELRISQNCPQGRSAAIGLLRAAAPLLGVRCQKSEVKVTYLDIFSHFNIF